MIKLRASGCLLSLALDRSKGGSGEVTPTSSTQGGYGHTVPFPIQVQLSTWFALKKNVQEKEMEP